MRYDNVAFISSGSKAEGLDLNGSDYDQMVVYNNVDVYENIQDAYPSHRLSLVMDNTDNKPGFTKLQIYKSSVKHLSQINEWSYNVEQPILISSKLFRESFLRHVHEKQTQYYMKIHGPCLSSENESYDSAKCFRCKEWIKPAKQWIKRSCTWLNNALTHNI